MELTNIFVKGILFTSFLIVVSCQKEAGCEAMKISNGSFPDQKIAINDSNYDGENLNINITYQGCEKNYDFDLIWDGSIAESLPVQTSLLVVSNQPIDHSCTTLVEKELCFDIIALFTKSKEEKIRVRFYQNPNIDILIMQ